MAVVNGSGPGGHLTSLALPGSIFSASGVVLSVTDIIGAFPLAGLQLTAHNGAGTVFGSGLPLAGAAKLCAFGACGSALANITVPLSVVGGGTATATSGFAPTVIGAPWTTGTAAVGSITRMGFAHGPASGTSSTAAASGTIQLVTPIFVSTTVSNDQVFESFATLTLHFVPEPATLLLVASALALLAAGAQRTRR